MKDFIKMVVLLALALFAVVVGGCADEDDGKNPPPEVNSGTGSQRSPGGTAPGSDNPNSITPPADR